MRLRIVLVFLGLRFVTHGEHRAAVNAFVFFLFFPMFQRAIFARGAIQFMAVSGARPKWHPSRAVCVPYKGQRIYLSQFWVDVIRDLHTSDPRLGQGDHGSKLRT